MSDPSNLGAPVQGGAPPDDDNASQSSQRSTTSLLERIRMQREREKQQKSAASNDTNARLETPVPAETPLTMQIQVPQYQPVEGPSPSAAEHGGPPAVDSSASSSFFQSAWHNISTSMETGMASLEQQRHHHHDDGYRRYADHDDRLDEALLLPASAATPTSTAATDEDYSMCNYFLTFVRDIYLGFVAVPLVGRVVMVIVLLYIAIKLL